MTRAWGVKLQKDMNCHSGSDKLVIGQFIRDPDTPVPALPINPSESRLPFLSLTNQIVEIKDLSDHSFMRERFRDENQLEIPFSGRNLLIFLFDPRAPSTLVAFIVNPTELRRSLTTNPMSWCYIHRNSNYIVFFIFFEKSKCSMQGSQRTSKA